MLKFFRWMLRLTLGLIAISAVLGAVAWYFALRSLPDFDAEFRVSGISAPVEIVRSTDSVPHIFASNDEDAYFALGLAHAQDRLFQMTVLRRAALGTLSEIYGVRTLPQDDLARRLGIGRAARQSLAAQTPQTRAALLAYASGVNAWITEINENALGRGAPEFFLFPDEITYWQPADSIAILKLYAAASSRQIPAEQLRAALSLALPEHGQEVVAELGEPDLQAYGDLMGSARIIGEPPAAAPGWPWDLAGYLAPFAGRGGTGFAAQSPRTASGAPLLASDPESALTLPQLWYLARLGLGSGDVIGATIPGVPAVISGRSPNLAWGPVPAQIDDADLFVEEIQPGDPNRYRGPRGWEDFALRREHIRIRDAEDQTITLRSTENGPLLSGAQFGLHAITPVGHAMALSWTGQSAKDTTMSALIGVMTAASKPAAIEAARGWVAPAVRLTLADGDGVSAHLFGHIPDRDPAHETGGRMPTPGWRSVNRWRGTRPAEGADMTRDGIDITTGAITAAEAPLLGYAGDSRLRAARLRHILEGREVHSRDSFIETQLDIVSPNARAILPLIGADLWFTGEPAALGTTERQRQDALRLLAEWDGAMNEHLPEPLIYAAWMRHLQDRLLRDDLGLLTDHIPHPQPAFIERVYRNRNGAARWCDVRQSAAVETCSTVARQALDAAIVELTQEYGPDVTSWRWGNAHQAVQLHPALGPLSRLGWIANLRQSVSGGDATLARAPLLGAADHPYQTASGAGYRGVYDMADPDSSVFIIASGQSGHPFSRHYDDLAVRWRRGEYITMSLDPDLARAAALGITRLIPESQPARPETVSPETANPEPSS